VINRCINEIKRKRTELVFVDDLSLFNNSEGEEETKISFDVKSVKKAMEQLPDGSRMIFSLYLLEGYDHREIAEILGVSESNSKSQYFRAKKRIKEILKGGNYENG
jgi:RNA polymerase sigma-70 factor (ECF subfamily)